MFSSEYLVFWLIHLFVGVILPLMIYSGCCGLRNREPVAEDISVPQR